MGKYLDLMQKSKEYIDKGFDTYGRELQTKTTTAVNLSHGLALERQNNRIFARNSWKKLLLEQAAILILSTRLTGAEDWRSFSAEIIIPLTLT